MGLAVQTLSGILESSIPSRIRLAREVASVAGCTVDDFCYMFAAPTSVETLVNHASRSENRAAQNKSGVTFTANSFLTYDGTLNGLTQPLVRNSTFVTRQNLPDTAYGYVGAPGLGFTCTGMAKDPTNGTWWVVNFGRISSSVVVYTPSLMNVSSDFSTKISEIDLLTAYPSIGNVQGLAYDTSDNTLWFTDSDNNAIGHISKTGTVLTGLSLAFSPNSLTYDPTLNCLIYNQTSSIIWANKTTGATIKSITSGGGYDHLYFDSTSGVSGTLWGSYGPNGAPAGINRYDVATQLWTGHWSIPEIQAVEGLHCVGGVLTLVEDARYHNVGYLTNSAAVYNLIEPNPSPMTRVVVSGKMRCKTVPGSTKAFAGGGSGLNGYGIELALPSGGTTFRLIIGAGQSPITVNWTVSLMTTAFRFYLDINLTAATAALYINGSLVSSQAIAGIKASIPDMYWNIGGAVEADIVRGNDSEIQAFLMSRVGGKFAETDAALVSYLTAVGAP